MTMSTTTVESSSNNSNNNFLGLATVATLSSIGIGYYYYWMTMATNNSKNKKFHMNYKDPNTPFILKLIALLMPRYVRERFGCLINAPTQPLMDERTLHINPNAEIYRKEEILSNKIWRVGYTFQSELIPLFKEIFQQSYTPDDAQGVIDNAPDHLKSIIEQDTIKYSKVWCLDCNDAKKSGDYLKYGVKDEQFMTIIKLSSGGLLLYSPIRIHDDLYEWIATLGGQVEWIVLGSSAHTTNLKGVIEQYPNAKIIGQHNAELKLQTAGLHKSFDYITEGGCKNCISTDNPRHISHAIEPLKHEGVELIHIKGDLGTDAICLISNGCLMECDLAYGYHTGYHSCFCAPQTLEAKMEWETSDEIWLYRHFYYHQLHKSKSPNGYLPDYRFQIMDWNDPMLKSFGGECKPDDCKILYTSLKDLINRNDYNKVIGVHFQYVLTAINFKKSIDKCWNWLLPVESESESTSTSSMLLLDDDNDDDDNDGKQDEFNVNKNSSSSSTSKKSNADKVIKEGGNTTNKFPNA